MNKWQVLLCALASLSLTACVSYRNPQTPADFKLEPDEGLIIIGKPTSITLSLDSGTIIDNTFRNDQYLSKALLSYGGNEYMIRKVKATADNDVYGLLSFFINGRWFSPNCGHTIFTITVKPGQIQYYGDVYLKMDGTQGMTYLKNNIDKAKADLANVIPMDGQTIVPGEMKSYQQGRCQVGGTVTVPVYVGGRHR